jgi:site-specific recombinase XerD
MSVETVKYLSKEQVEKVFARITSKRDRAMFALMYLYGLRCTEAARLTFQDLRLEDRRLFVQAAKRGNSGEVSLGNDILRYLRAYLTERGNMPGALFLSRKGGKLSTRQIRRLFEGYAEKMPEDKRHPHVLRHSIAIHMVEQGEDVRLINQHLRQKSMQSTSVYVQIADKKRLEMQERALNGIGIARIESRERG